MKVLQAFMKGPTGPSRIHIVLDGLDECCDEASMRALLPRLISTHPYGILKWVLTSRNDGDVHSIINQIDAVEIEPSPAAVISDIKTYLVDRTSQHDLQMCCVDSWAEASGGNFLWMSFMVRIMAGLDLTCEEEIGEELEKFPAGLTGCYLRSLERLLLRSPQQQELARRIFAILVVAEQPLRLSELSNALGIKDNAADFSSKRIPRLGLIEELCSHLVIFDRSTEGDEKDPLLKLAYKSVEDFFYLNPDSLDVPVSDGLRQYFVNQEAANLELGKACLTYLNYSRYSTPLPDFTKIHEVDHAFLRYAATFWFRHLMRAIHSLELFQSVENFIRSENFWTCLSVQSTIAPHLFAHYTELDDGYFRLGSGNIQSDAPTAQKMSIAFPLPDWLEEYEPIGPMIIEEFYYFIKEWHPLLTSHSEALNHCVRDLTGSTFPCRNPTQLKEVQILRLKPAHKLKCYSKLQLHSLKAMNHGIRVTLMDTASTNCISLQRAHVMEPFSIATVVNYETTEENQRYTTTTNSNMIFEVVETGGELPSLWTLDLDNLSLTRHNSVDERKYPSTKIIGKHTISPVGEIKRPWILATRAIPNETNQILAFHCVKHASSSKTTDSVYGVWSSHSEPENDTESESSEASDSEGEAIDMDDLDYHCLAVAAPDCDPLWFPWHSDSRTRLQIVIAAHPQDPIAVWSHNEFEFSAADLQSGSIKTGMLREPVDIPLKSSTRIYKEMQFSTDGTTLFYLVCSLSNNESGCTCTVSFLSFLFPQKLNELEDLDRSNLSSHITCHLSCSAKAIPQTFILTHWTPKYLYMTLLLQSSDPKIVRLSLETEFSSFQILQSPLYFPFSLPNREPKFYVHTFSSQEFIILAVNPDTQRQHTTVPSLIVWSLPGGNCWREWDADTDSRSPEQQTYEQLRGTFVDSQQRFSIPIRSGLDWRKKAFLSCA